MSERSLTTSTSYANGRDSPSMPPIAWNFTSAPSGVSIVAALSVDPTPRRLVAFSRITDMARRLPRSIHVDVGLARRLDLDLPAPDASQLAGVGHRRLTADRDARRSGRPRGDGHRHAGLRGEHAHGRGGGGG